MQNCKFGHLCKLVVYVTYYVLFCIIQCFVFVTSRDASTQEGGTILCDVNKVRALHISFLLDMLYEFVSSNKILL